MRSMAFIYILYLYGINPNCSVFTSKEMYSYNFFGFGLNLNTLFYSQ